MRRRYGLLVALAVLGLIVAACGDDDTATSDVGSDETTATDDVTATTESNDSIEMVTVDLYFVDDEAFTTGTEPYVVVESRDVSAADPVASTLAALYDGPTTEGLSHVASGTTNATVTVADGVATVSLEGACDSGGSTLTVADEIIPTMKQFDEVDVVKILDADGATLDPSGDIDSTPECLQP